MFRRRLAGFGYVYISQYSDEICRYSGKGTVALVYYKDKDEYRSCRWIVAVQDDRYAGSCKNMNCQEVF